MIQEKKKYHHRFDETKRPPIQFDLLNLINVQKPHTVFLTEYFRMLRQKTTFHGRYSKWFLVPTHLNKTINSMLVFLRNDQQ